MGSHVLSLFDGVEHDSCCVCFFVYYLSCLSLVPLTRSYWGIEIVVCKKVLNPRRNCSAPGINMIPCKVYKYCPNICDYLFRLFKSCFQNCVVPVQWRIATEVYIPKSGSPDPNNIKDFRPISLLNVEGKLFFSILSKRLEKHIIIN